MLVAGMLCYGMLRSSSCMLQLWLEIGVCDAVGCACVGGLGMHAVIAVSVSLPLCLDTCTHVVSLPRYMHACLLCLEVCGLVLR
jgi:hypothetical protein